MGAHDRVSFAGSAGATLVGVVDLPPKAPEAYALIAHCFTGGKANQATRRISRALCERGLAVLRFDFAGLGESSGDFADSTFSSNVADLVLAAEHLREQYGSPSLLVGHSLGGAVAIAAATQILDLRAIATIAAPSDPAHVTGLFDHARQEILAEGEAVIELAGREFRVRREFLEDLHEQPQRERIAALDRPLLVLHAPKDEIVGIDNAGAIYQAARHPKSFVCLDGADHLLTDRRQAERAAQLIAAWADPYLPETFTPEID